MNLYELRAVPDPDGLLAELLEELIDNSALVPVEQMERVWWCGFLHAHPSDGGWCSPGKPICADSWGCGWRYLVPVPKEGE